MKVRIGSPRISTGNGKYNSDLKNSILLLTQSLYTSVNFYLNGYVNLQKDSILDVFSTVKTSSSGNQGVGVLKSSSITEQSWHGS